MNKPSYRGSARESLKKELLEFLEAAVFFAVAFCLITLANKLLVRGSDVHVSSFAQAIVGGLIVGKVLLIVDLLPFVDAFPGKPIIYNIVWKSAVYTVASLLFRYLKPVTEALFHGAGMDAAQHDALELFAHPQFWAVQIWIALLLAVFVTMHELSRALGKDKLRLIFFGR